MQTDRTPFEPIPEPAAPELEPMLRSYEEYWNGALTDWFNELYAESRLEPQTIELVMTSLLAWAGFDAGVRIHGHFAAERGASAGQIKGAILLASLVGGTRVLVEGIRWVEPSLPPTGHEGDVPQAPSQGTLYEGAFMAPASRRYGDFVGAATTTWFEAAKEASRLSELDAELIMTALMAADGFETGLRAHARRALRAGATIDEVRGAALLAWGVAGPRTALTALAQLDGLEATEPMRAR